MTVETLQRRLVGFGGVKRPNRIYAYLVGHFPPRSITKGSEHRDLLRVVEFLMREIPLEKDAEARAGMRQFVSVVAPFIEAYEKSRWPSEAAGGREVLAYLLEANGLDQGDLESEIGKQPYVSDILKGKKRLTAAQIGRLATRFGVSPAAFFPT